MAGGGGGGGNYNLADNILTKADNIHLNHNKQLIFSKIHTLILLGLQYIILKKL